MSRILNWIAWVLCNISTPTEATIYTAQIAEQSRAEAEATA